MVEEAVGGVLSKAQEERQEVARVSRGCPALAFTLSPKHFHSSFPYLS